MNIKSGGDYKMQFVYPSVTLVDEKDNFKRIEQAARICYQSLDKISEDSAYPFFQRMCKNGHTSTLEHSVIFVRVHTANACMKLKQILTEYVEDTGYQHYIRYSKWDNDFEIYNAKDIEYDSDANLGDCVGNEHLFSGNIRAWRKICDKFAGEIILRECFSKHPAFNDIFEAYDIKLYGSVAHESNYIYGKDQIEIVDSIPTDPSVFPDAYKHNIATLRIVGDRGVIDEYARHRVCGISIESSRYCDYSKNGTTFVFPWWYEKLHEDQKYVIYAGDFANRCYDTEIAYQEWMKKCKIPQMARGNLTLWVKSEGAFTATIQQWIDILSLRDSPAAHPEAQKIAKMIEEVLVNEAGVKDIWGVKDNGLQGDSNNGE